MATRYHFPVLRTDALAAIGGYDATLSSTEQADADLTIRLVTTGRKGKLLPRPACTYHLRRRPPENGSPMLALPPVVSGLLRKHRALFERHWMDAIIGQENQRRRLQAITWTHSTNWRIQGKPAAVDWGNLRRLQPVEQRLGHRPWTSD